jgi:glycogen operon protein
VLAGTKLIAEAWDAAGLYQVGSFIGDTWTEWNGKFRDDIRSFLKGDERAVPKLPARLMASPDLYGHKMRAAEQSINFVTCHDGFTLNDLVSYNGKHNEANGENNNDGSNDNVSWNCGMEGPTVEPKIEAMRNRQVKNFLTLNLLSLGTPMLLMGDEVRRTQFGNNNAYCQDNELSWFDWALLQKHPDILRFTQQLITYRLNGKRGRDLEHQSLNERLEEARIQWHGVKLNYPDWGDNSHALAFTVQSQHADILMHVMMNAYWGPLTFEIPNLQFTRPNSLWKQWIDTSKDAPNDIIEFASAPPIMDSVYKVEERSVVILLA